MEENKFKYENPKALRENIAVNVRKYRKDKHLTQEELAEGANISYEFMKRIETNAKKCGFSVFTIYKIAVALNVSLDNLFDIEIKEQINENSK